MNQVEKPQLFTELNPEEAASVNGGWYDECGNWHRPRRYYRTRYRRHYYRPYRVRYYSYTPRYYSRVSYSSSYNCY